MPFALTPSKGKPIDLYGDDVKIFKTSEEAGSEVRSGLYRSPFADPLEQEKSRLGIGERIDAGVSALGERMFGKPEVNPADINQAGLQSVAARNAEIDRRAAAYRAEIEQRNGLERAIGAVVDPIAAGIANTVGGVAGYAGRKFGIQALQDIEMKAAADAKALMGNDPNLAQKVLQGVGSAGAGVATAIPAAIGAMYAGAPLGVATTIGALASTAVNQSGVAQEAYRGAMEATGNEKVADVRGDTAAAATMIPNFFLDKFGVKLGLGAAAGTSMTARAGRVAGAGLLEGAQEGFVEQPAINIASYRPAGEGVAESALVGGLSGAAVRGAQEIGMRGGQQQQDPLANLPEQNIDQVVPGSQARAAQEPGKPLPDVFVVTPDGTAIPAQDFSPEAYDRYKRSQQGDPVPLLGFSQPEGNRRFLLTDQRSGEQIVVLPDGTAIPRSEFNQAEYDSLVSARDDRIQRGLLLAYSPESDRPFFVAPDGNAFRSYVDYRSHVAELAQNTEDQRMAALAAQKTPRVRLNELETTDNASVLVFDKGRNGVLGTIQPGAKTVEIDGTRVPITKSMTFIPVEEKILRTREEIRAENSPAFDVQLPMDFAFQGAPKADGSVTGTVKQVSYGLSLVADPEIPGRLRPVRHTDVLINGKMVRLPGTLPQEAVGQKLRISTAKGSDGVRYGVESTQLQKPVVARSGKPQALPNVSTAQQVPALPSATQEVQPVTEAQAPAPIVKTVKKTPSRAIATGVQPLNYQDGTRGAMVRMDNGSAIEIQEQGNQWVDTTGQVLGNNLEQAVQAVQTRERKGGEVAQTTNERLETVSQQQAGTPTEPEAATKAKQISKGKRNATQKGKQQQDNQQQRQEDRGRVETRRDDRQQQTEEQGKGGATSGSDRPAKSKEEIKKERLERINAAQRAKNPDYGKKIGEVTVAAFKRISARIEDTWNAFVRALDGMARAAEQRDDGARTGRDTEEATVVRATQRLDTALREIFGNDAEIARLRLQQNENAANLVREKLESGKLAVPGNVDRGVLKALEPTELLEKLGTGRTELEARMQSLIELASRPNPTPLMQAVIRSKTKDIQAAIARYKGIPEDQRQQAFDDLRQLATARSNIRNQTPEVTESKRARAVEQDKDQNNQMALALQRAFTGESEKPMDPRDLRDTMKNGPVKDVPTVKEISAARELYDENRADNQPTFDRFVKDEPLLAAAWIDAVNSSPAYSSIAYFDDLQARYNKNQRATKSNEKVAENRVAAVEGAKNDVITDRYLAIVKKSLSRADNQVLNDVYGDAKQSTLRSGFAKDLLAFYNGEKVDPRVEAIIKKVDKVIKAADTPADARARENFWGGDLDRQFFDADMSALLEKTDDIREVLDFIYRASPDVDSRILAKKFLDNNVQGQIRKYDASQAEKGQAADANHLLQRIRLFADIDLEYLVLHESTHLATNNAIFLRSPAARSLEKIYNEIKSRSDAKPYGLENLNEFVSELNSNKDFQEFLADTPSGGYFRNMLDRVINAVRRLLGMSPYETSALRKAMLLSDKLIQEDRILTDAGVLAASADISLSQGPRSDRKNSLASRVLDMSADRFKRTPALQQAVSDLQEGLITRDEYNKVVDEARPVYPYEDVPQITSEEDARFALATGKGQSQEKAAKYGLPAKELTQGEVVQLRLDIPSYQLHDAWVVTVHRPKTTNRNVQSAYDAGPTVGYESVASITDATFGMNQKSALKIAQGAYKGTIATILGNWKPISNKEAMAKAEKAINDPAWTQVGMDPFRHSYFYDRDSMRPVLSADEVIQVGPLVLAKNVKFGEDTDVTGAPLLFSFGRAARTAKYSRPVEVYAYDKNGDVVGLAQMDPSSGDWRVFLSQSGDIRKTSNYTTQLFNKTDDAIKAMRGPGIRLVRRKESPVRGSVSPGDMVEISTDVVPSNKISAAIDAALGKMGIRPDNVRRLITDSEIDIRSVIDNLRKDGHAVGSDLDFYAALTRTPGATGAALDKFNRQFVEPLEKTYAALMKKGVTAKEINQYLTAKHAEERNDVIAQRNPAMPDGGSGMTTADARALLQSFAGRSYAADLDALSKIFEDMSDFKVKLMQDKGLIDSKTAASLKKYKNYVNLRGLDEDPEEIHAAVGIAKKPGPALKTAKGRATEAANIIQNTILDAEAVILKAYQNEARQSLLKLAEKFPDPDFWVVAPIKSRMVIDKKTGNVRFAGDPTLANSVHSAEIFVDGELVRVEMKDAHFATAVNKAADKLPDVVDKVAKVMAAYNRWKAMLLTQLNPEWAITNAFRDAGAAIANVKVDESEKQIPQETLKEAAKSYASSMREMFKYVRDPDNAPGAVAAKIRRFEELGGTTKFFGLNDIEQKLNKFRDLEAKAQNKGVRGKALNLIEKSKVGDMLDVIMDLNSTVEMLPRFAAFDALTKLGVDDQTAATYAKNLNVNFNRRGELGWLSNVYLFFNAAVQGNVRTVKALGTKTGGAIAGGLFVAGLIEAAIGHALDDDENDNGKPDIEELSDYDRNTNIVIPVGGNNYFKIPLPYGFNAIKAAGSHMGDSIWGTKSPVKAAWATLRAFSDAYNPIGAGDSSSAANTAIKMISPEITDPIVEYALNENRYGAPIRKENRPGMPSLPDSELYFDSVSGVSKAVSSFLNSATGGNKFVSGVIDINPAAIDQFFGAILPGTPSVVTRGVNTAVKAATSEAEIEIREIPFVRRVLTEPAKASTYKDYSEVKALIDQLKNIDNNGVREQRQKLKEFPGWRGVEAQLDAAESIRKDLVTRKQSIRNGDVKVADKDLEIQKIDEKILKLENRVLKRYNAVSDAW